MSKQHKTILLTAPEYLGLKTINGEPKAFPIHIDIKMAELIRTLWKRGIGTIGCCEGNNNGKTVNRNIAWFQIGVAGVTWELNWVTDACIEKTMRVLDEIATFPVYMYDPRCIPIKNPEIHILRKHYEQLIDSGYEFDVPFTMWF